MIGRIPIKKEWLEQAKKDSQHMGMLNKSITEGQGNLAGFIGELVVQAIIGGVRKNTYDYDIIKNDKFIDVKTKRCTSEPKLNYDCSVAAYNTKQNCTHYVFTRA